MKILSKRSLPLTLAGTMVVTNLGALIPMTAYAATEYSYDITYKLSAKPYAAVVDATGATITPTSEEIAAVTGEYAAAAENADYVQTVTSTTSSTITATLSDNNIDDGETNDFALEGFTLSGWAKKEGATTPDYDLGQKISVTADTTLYPVWADAGDSTVQFGTATATSFVSGNKITTLTQDEYEEALGEELTAGTYLSGWKLSTSVTSALDYDTVVSPGSTTQDAYEGTVVFTAETGSYTAVTLDANGGSGSVSDTQYADADGNYVLPTPGSVGLYRDGYTFKGWSATATANASSSIKSAGTTVNVSTSSKWYAQWTANDYTLTVSLDNSDEAIIKSSKYALTSSGTTTVVKGLDLNDTLDLSSLTVTLANNALLGWNLDSDKSTADYTSSIKLDTSVLTNSGTDDEPEYTLVLYPVYESAYSITYNGVDTDDYEDYANIVYSESTTHTVLDYPSEYLDDEVFYGYTTASDIDTDAEALAIIDGSDTTNKLISVGDTIKYGTTYSSAVILYPVTLSEFTVSFKGNGYSSGSMSSQSVVYGGELTLASNGFKKTGYAFDYWTASAAAAKLDGDTITTSTEIPDGATLTDVTGAIVLTAVWATPDTFKITFIANGGSGSMDAQEITEQAGDALNTCTFTAPSLKKFAGWATTASGSVVYADGATTESITEDTILYAVWEDDTEAIEAQEKEAAEKAAAEQKAAEEKAAAEKAAAQATGATGTDSASGNTYKVTDGSSKTVAITKAASNASGKVTIPSTVTISGDQFTVTEISANAFKGNKKIKQVVIPKTVTKIGKNAFKNCSKVTKITIKATKNLTVGKNAFKGLKKGSKIVVKGLSGSAKKKLVKKIKKQVTSSRTTVK